MAALESVIGAIVTEPCRFVFGYVQASINNFCKRKSNFNDLKNHMSHLVELKDQVQQKLDRKDEQLGDFPAPSVKLWVKAVEEFKTKMDEFQSTISTSDGNNLQDSCCPFPLQCKLSNKLARKIKEAKGLMGAGQEMFEKMGVVRDKTIVAEHIRGPSIIDQKTASENLARLLDLLRKDDVTRIGVRGMGGIGKTTLVQNLNNKLEKEPSEHDFRVIIWVTVSKDTDLKRIQTRIAKRLKVEVEVEPDENIMAQSMASVIHDRLLKEKPFLLILDDVWKEINLDDLGIPRPDLCSRSKIIITTREFDVCRRMVTQENLEVNVLNEKEAWELFSKYAGTVVMKEGIRTEAEKVLKECAGLPLAITVVGASMREKNDVALWENALRELQTSEPLEGTEDKIFKPLKWSYDSLQCRTTKICFLFCCLYPEDFNIEVDELVRYWFCEGLLKEHLNYEQIKNQGIATIRRLRDCCLLEDGNNENTVKMHDVIRDVGIWIAGSVEGECRSLVRSGIGLTVLQETNFSSYRRLSFMNNRIASLPDCVEQCEEVSTLLLQGNERLDTLPASFLEGFQNLKTLDLSGSKITSLPSLLQLRQLRALILRQCHHLTELPPLDGQSRLLLLDCSHSGLRKLPESLEKLSNLRQLDVSHTPNLVTIPYCTLSKLSNLELLKLSYDGRIEGQRLFEVLPFLKRLIVLRASLDSIPHLTSNNVNWSKGIKRFQIGVGNCQHLVKWGHKMRENCIILNGVCLSEESIGWLLCDVKNLRFKDCVGLTQMFNKLILDDVSFASLKKLQISESNISFEGSVASFDLMPNLEMISLIDVRKLENVSDLSKLLGLRFSRLKWILICSCPQLKRVICLEEHQTLKELERIEVVGCKMLKSLFDYPSPMAQHMNQNPTAPNLQIVSLMNLPNLKNLWGNDESWQNVRELVFHHCPKIRKLPLTAQNAESIVGIRGEIEWWNGLEWDSEDTKMLLQRRYIDVRSDDLKDYTRMVISSIINEEEEPVSAGKRFGFM